MITSSAGVKTCARSRMRLRRPRPLSEHMQIYHTIVRHPFSVWCDRNFVKLRKFLRKSSARDKLLATLQYYFQLRRASLRQLV